MVSSVFDDKAVQPDEQMLSTGLGKNIHLWQKIKKHLQSEYGELIEEWKYYNQKSGWIMKTLRKKRNLFFLTPLKNGFRVSFVFGDKAVAAIEKSDLPDSIINTLKNARKYAEGRGLSIEVNTPQDVENIKKLVDIKIHN